MRKAAVIPAAIIAVSFLSCCCAGLAFADAVYVLGNLRITNFQCQYYEWTPGPYDWARLDRVRTIDSYTTFTSNTSSFSVLRRDDTEIVLHMGGNVTRNQSTAAVDFTGLTFVDGGHFGQFSFDLVWSMNQGGRSVKLVLDPVYLWQSSGPTAGLAPAPAPAYSRTLHPAFANLHITGDMGNSRNVIFRLVVVPEPAALLSLLCGVAGLGACAWRRCK